jgi:voltage-gated potassium channel
LGIRGRRRLLHDDRPLLGRLGKRARGRAVEDQEMARERDSHWFGRRLEKRIDRKGLRPRYAAYVIVAFWTFAIVVFSVVERLIDPETFDSIWLAMWWATQTVTTVGYGDVVPQQTAGKVIAAFLMLGGLSMVAVVTAVITSAFVTRAQAARREAGDDPVMRKLEAIEADLARLRQRDGD